MKEVPVQKDPSSRKKNEAMVHILVLTQKNVACCRGLSELPIFLCDDKTDGEPDYTLLAFLPFLNAVPQQKPSGFMFSLLGDIHSTEDFSNAIAYAHTLRADLVVWYSFAMTAQSEGRAVWSANRCAQRDIFLANKLFSSLYQEPRALRRGSFASDFPAQQEIELIVG
jgi:hypothetical protein